MSSFERANVLFYADMVDKEYWEETKACLLP